MPVTKMPITYRDYQPGDEHGIVALHNSVFDAQIDLPFWRWLFENNPAGTPSIALATIEDRIVGHFAAYPLRMQINGGVVTGSKSCLTMVSKECRGKGTFGKLAAHLFETLDQRGIPITIGNPNRNSYRVFTTRAGYVDFFPEEGLPFLVAPLRPGSMFAARFGLPAWTATPTDVCMHALVRFKHGRHRSTLHVEEFTSFDERFDTLWQRMACAWKNATVRDRQYLDWRYRKGPNRYTTFLAENGSELCGYIVLRERVLFGMRIGLIVDLVHDPVEGDIAQELACAATTHFMRRECDAMACLMLPHAAAFKGLRRSGFWNLPAALKPRAFHYTMHFNGSTQDVDPVRDPENWFLTWGDTEDG